MITQEKYAKHDLTGDWHIQKKEGDRPYIHLWNDELSFSDFPLYFNGKVSYDSPEKIPKDVKNAVKELFKSGAFRK